MRYAGYDQRRMAMSFKPIPDEEGTEIPDRKL